MEFQRDQQPAGAFGRPLDLSFHQAGEGAAAITEQRCRLGASPHDFRRAMRRPSCFQFPPVGRRMRFSRTRLTDFLHRRQTTLACRSIRTGSPGGRSQALPHPQPAGCLGRPAAWTPGHESGSFLTSLKGRAELPSRKYPTQPCLRPGASRLPRVRWKSARTVENPCTGALNPLTPRTPEDERRGSGIDRGRRSSAS